MEGLRRVRVFHALRYRDFRLLYAGQTVFLIGDAAFLTALGWRTFTLVGAGRFGIVLFCQATGLLATLLIGGALADRISRRKMMIVSASPGRGGRRARGGRHLGPADLR